MCNVLEAATSIFRLEAGLKLEHGLKLEDAG